jgi:hypothetical protein
MTRERLLQLSVDELKELAIKEDVDLPQDDDKEELVDAILEAFEELEEERKDSNNTTVKIEEKKYVVAHDEEIELGGKSEYTLPASYGSTRIALLVRDPAWAYTYWELTEDLKNELKATPGFEGIILRIHDIKLVDFNGQNSNYSIDIPVHITDNNWYINIPNPDSAYVIELLSCVNGQKKTIAMSNKMHVPREGFSDKRDDEWNSRNTDKIIELIMNDFEYFLPATGAIPQRIISFVSSSFIPYMHNK